MARTLSTTEPIAARSKITQSSRSKQTPDASSKPDPIPRLKAQGYAYAGIKGRVISETIMMSPKSELNRKEQEELFSDPEYFNLPVLIIHAAYTDFAVSYHAPDRLNELDALWSCFPCDLEIYGTRQRGDVKTVKMILNRAYRVLQNAGVTDCRLAFKGYSHYVLSSSFEHIQETFEGINFVSLTDLTRKLGEENPVYQRPLPRYPVWKQSLNKAMTDGPRWAPTKPLDKFTRLNVKWLDKPPEDKRQAGLRVVAVEQGVGKYGFKTGKKGAKPKEEIKEHPGLANMYELLSKQSADK